MKSHCRFCETPLTHTFCDLGHTPLSNSYLKTIDEQESYFPLHAYVCDQCLLVQLGQFHTPTEIFSHYSYFSSYSTSWVEHARLYTEMVTKRFQLTQNSYVVEIASNDGYLLQHFREKEILHLGIEPAQNVAKVAQENGVDTLVAFFGKDLAQTQRKADLIIGNNVLAHVPDLNDFVAGLKVLLAPSGVITLEFPHLLQLMQQNQFDTIYHEHFSYFSFLSAEKIFSHHELEVFDVEELPTHGGSLRVYLQHVGGVHTTTANVNALREKERHFSLDQLKTYQAFSSRVVDLKTQLLALLQSIKEEGKKIAGYGAPAKGNTLLNYCTITTDLLPFTVDISPHKQGHFLPGSRIPIDDPKKIFDYKPDYLLVLPWNLKEEITSQMAGIRDWGGQFILPVPELCLI